MWLGDEGTEAAGRVVAPREEGTGAAPSGQSGARRGRPGRGASRAARGAVRRGRPGGAGADRAQRGRAAGAPSGQASRRYATQGQEKRPRRDGFMQRW